MHVEVDMLLAHRLERWTVDTCVSEMPIPRRVSNESGKAEEARRSETRANRAHVIASRSYALVLESC